MKKPRSRKYIPLLFPELTLSPEEQAAGCVIVDVPLTAMGRQHYENGKSRTGLDPTDLIRDVLRVIDIVSTIEAAEADQLYIQKRDTGEIVPINLSLKAN
jgi:hypothetical protein